MNQNITAPDIDRALKYDISDIRKKYSQTNGVPPEVALEIEKELKRYLILSGLNPDRRYPMTTIVDPLWHEFILETRRYSDFCSDGCGGFIHHKSSLPTEERKHVAERFDIFFGDYLEVFGEEAPKHIWPRISIDNAGTGGSPCHAQTCSTGMCGANA